MTPATSARTRANDVCDMLILQLTRCSAARVMRALSPRTTGPAGRRRPTPQDVSPLPAYVAASLRHGFPASNRRLTRPGERLSPPGDGGTLAAWADQLLTAGCTPADLAVE